MTKIILFKSYLPHPLLLQLSSAKSRGNIYLVKQCEMKKLSWEADQFQVNIYIEFYLFIVHALFGIKPGTLNINEFVMKICITNSLHYIIFHIAEA